MDLYNELSSFREALKDYKKLLSKLQSNQPLPADYQPHRENLLTNSSYLVSQIKTLTGRDEPLVIHEMGKPRAVDMWQMGLRNEYDYRTVEALDACIDNTTLAIGKLEADIKTGIRDEQGNLIEKAQRKCEDITEAPRVLFDKMQFHPKVVEASKDCFIAGNYREAILNAFITLIDYVKERTKLITDNKDLMAKAFNLNNPVIKLNSLKEQYERDEQEGFRFLYMGAAVGIRNPKAHKLIPQSNPLHTLEYLAFASLLMRRVEEGELTS
jgi:uncharacterized protein (TIGR02391 family)